MKGPNRAKLPDLPEDIPGLIEKAFLEKHNTVFFRDIVEDISIGALVAKLLFLSKANDDLITIYLDTYGGDEYDFLNLYDTIRSINNPVRVIAQGRAWSAGALIIALCATEKRLCYKHTSFLVHEGTFWTEGRKGDVKRDTAEIDRVDKLLDRMIAMRTNVTLKELKARTGSNWWFDSKEAKALGFVDRII